MEDSGPFWRNSSVDFWRIEGVGLIGIMIFEAEGRSSLFIFHPEDEWNIDRETLTPQDNSVSISNIF
jgi:hypothetical protein